MNARECPAYARHREVLARDAETRIRIAQFSRLHLQKTEIVLAGFACNLRAVIDRHRRAAISQTNAAGKEQLIDSRAAEEKDARVLEKEVAFLGKEDREATEVYHLIINFGLTEVRIRRELGG